MWALPALPACLPPTTGASMPSFHHLVPAAEALLPVNFLGAPRTFSGLTQLILSDLAQAPSPPEVRRLPSLSPSSYHAEMQLESGCDCDRPGGEEAEATQMWSAEGGGQDRGRETTVGCCGMSSGCQESP